MAVFPDAVGAGALWNAPLISGPIELLWAHPAPKGSQVAVVAAVSYWVGTAALGDLTRKCWYGLTEMASLGVKAWGSGTAHGWTELFGILNPPKAKGKQIVRAQIAGGGLLAGKLARANSVSYTGADGFGAVTDAAGNSAGTQSVAATAVGAAKIVAAFGGNQPGLNSFNRDQRYLSNTTAALLLGDATGTGSSLTFSTTRAKAGDWSALAVVINPADIVATATGVLADPDIHTAGLRLPRPGVNRRTVFTAGPED